MYTGCPLLQKPKLHAECNLLSTDSEHTGFSYTLHDYIHVIVLIKELKEKGLPIEKETAKVHWKVFEDKSRALEIFKSATI